MMIHYQLLTFIYLLILHLNARPNIIYMFGDDIGFNDVQFTSDDLRQPSSYTHTPHMNKLAGEMGVTLMNYYVQRMCSPSRASFLTGRYSFRYGMSSKLLEPDVKVSMSRQMSLISEEFKTAGYNTHAIGKWHLGFQSWEYTPRYRGFDTFYGYYNAWTDYYTSTYNIVLDDVEYLYYDLRENGQEILLEGLIPDDYSMHRFRDKAIEIIDDADGDEPFFMYLAWQSSHEPSEAPDEYYEIYEDETYSSARKYNQAQTTVMDDCVQAVVDALKANDLWENTLVVWSSDNGAPATLGDNFPLRGYKKTDFEGGMRVPAFVTGGYLRPERHGAVLGLSDGEYHHVTDWYPTLLEAAGIDEPLYAKSHERVSQDYAPKWETVPYTIPLDGASFWRQIQYGEENEWFSQRMVILDVISNTGSDKLNGSLRCGKWKYMKGLGTLDDYDGDDGMLWGDQFADISTDAHLWGQDFANLDIDNSLGCDLDTIPVNLYCYNSLDGCLFDLEADPCEFIDVSQENPEIFEYLKNYLQNIRNIRPTDVGSEEIYELFKDSADDWLPGPQGSFWVPWQDYDRTEFEPVLYEDYNRLYGDAESAEKMKEFVNVDLPMIEREISMKNKKKEMVEIASSCNDKVDGLHYIKPTREGNVIPVICNGGYTMLDGSLNFESLSSYFTSMYKYGDADRAIYGTDCGDNGGWRDWYIPANHNTKFRVARNCEICKSGGIYGDDTGYYMTNGYFCPVDLDIDGCSAKKELIGQIEPDIMCNICDDDEGICGTGEGRDGQTLFDHTVDPSWCDCFTLQLSADHLTTSHHKQYCQQDLVWRPNLVTDRSQCTCYKPQNDEERVYKHIKKEELPLVSAEFKSEIVDKLGLYVDDLIMWDDVNTNNENSKLCRDKMIYLSQQDFKDGTYRITQCGNYVLTEDILIHFGKPDKKFIFENGDSPNSYSYDNLPWFPSNEQQESGEYFGLNAFWGPYSIGFFAAIAIETSHVYIDLNGFSIGMDYEYYLQQRFFAIIELGNKQFEARQGPVDFGREDLCSKDIIIKGGTLGLSSHHGIHGSCAKNVDIHDLNIQNFDVTGIQCNGCKDMTISDCDIGPQNINIPVKGRYNHGRIMLARLRYLVDEYGDESIKFANREQATTVKELADKLVEQMDMAYYHIMDGIEFDELDPQWIAAQKTFLNPSGWMDGGSSYGILLNGYGTAVVNIGRRVTDTFGITIKNVEIHNIKVEPHENFWAATAVMDDEEAIVHGFFFETIDWTGGIYEDESGYYVGDTYTDLLFAANTFLRQDFCPLGPLFFLDGLMPWVFNDGKSVFDHDIGLDFRCGSDIQSHSAKGAIGLRIDGVKDYHLENIYIHNIVNWGKLGSSQCGEYEKILFETGVDVDADIQYGYTGTKVHGILTDYAHGSMKNIRIAHLKSNYGSVHGIALYKGSNVRLSGYFDINQVIAGSKMTKHEAIKLKLPNPPPYVCSIHIGPNSDHETMPENTPIVSTMDDFRVMASNIYGYDSCAQHARIGIMDNVNTPDGLLLFADKSTIINGDLLFSFNRNSFRNTIIMLIFFIISISIFIFYKLRKNKEIIKLPTATTTTRKRSITPKYGSI